MKVFLAPEAADDQQNEHKERGPRNRWSFDATQRKARRPSFRPPTTPKRSNTAEQAPSASRIETEAAHKPSVGYLSPPPCPQKPLCARRNVKLDLSLPVEATQAPSLNRSATVTFSSITASRQRSVKTPCVRDETISWQRNAGGQPISILEDTQDKQHAAPRNAEIFCLLPGDDCITSSQSPEHERPPNKPRYTSRPKSRRNRSSRNAHSESELDGPPPHSAGASKAAHEKQRVSNADLRELAQVSKTRSGRWRWTRSMTRSSDEALQTPVAESTTRRMSINPFKRSDRIADQTQTGKQRDKDKGTKQSSPPGRFWWMGKQAVAAPPSPTTNAQTTSAMITAPPVFIPPEASKVTSPPTLDVHGEVKGKLADFFFDHGTGATKRRARPSPSGHWDSDTLLMSYPTADMILHESTEEEGPEGPRTPGYVPTFSIVDQNPSYGTPGLVTPPGGYMDAKRLGNSVPQIPPSPDISNAWFRVQHQVAVEESQFTANALMEAEERRRFEWIVPEHLPTSPLCPLHEKYQGYSKGKCYWHKERKRKGKAQT